MPEEPVKDVDACTIAEATAAGARAKGGFVSATFFPPIVNPFVEAVEKVPAAGGADVEGKHAPRSTIPEKPTVVDANAEVKYGPSATGQDIGKIQ